MTRPADFAMDAEVLALELENAEMRRRLAAHEENVRLKERMAAAGLEPVAKVINLHAVARTVAAAHQLPLDRLTAPSTAPGAKLREVAWPRQEAMYLASSLTRDDGTPRYSLSQIGRYFGGRDHTTVLHAVRAVTSRRDLKARQTRDLH